MSRRRPLSEAEQALWAAVTVAVRPLKGQAARPKAPPKQVPLVIPAFHAPAPPARALPALAVGDGRMMDANTYHRFSTGRMVIAGRLDLHGLTQGEAAAALGRFLQFSLQRGRRCVLVITGKSGVLRRELPNWLNDETLRPHILALHPAKAEDGGAGAWYVLLRRRRD